MPDNKVKQATVVFVDGKLVGVNVTGKTVEADGPQKGKLESEQTVDLRDATIMAYDEGAERSTAKAIRPAEIRPGDKLSAGWAGNPAGAARPTSATVMRSKAGPTPTPTPELKLGGPRSFTQADAATGALDSAKTADGVPVGENYPNTHQLTGRPEGGGGPGRTAPGDEDGDVVDDSDTGEAADYESMTVAELKEAADSRKVEYDAHDKKADLIKKLRRSDR